ncbi:MAG: Ig-like domain-containing protein [Candidatus Thermoplasmatota archaeon]|nr:Ig-like domain-containing protein [Candidatus Thermoplasmatota archaeon]
MWAASERVTLNSGLGGFSPQLSPDIAVAPNGYVYIFWTRGDDNAGEESYDIAYTFNNGNVWSPIQYATVYDRVGYNYQNPQIAIDSQNRVHLVYEAHVPEYWGVHYQVLEDGVWSEAVRVDDGTGRFPAIALDSEDNVHIAWNDIGTDFLFYSSFDLNGNIRADNKQITENTEPDPSIVTIQVDNNNNVHFIEQAFSSGIGGCYYIKTDNLGERPTDLTFLSTNQGYSGSTFANPHFSIDSQNRIHAVFGDDRDGNTEIYYKSTYLEQTSVAGLSINPSSPTDQDNVSVSARVYNSGEDPSMEILVHVLVDGNIANSTIITLADGNMQTVDFGLGQLAHGAHTVEVVVDPGNVYTEVNEDDNSASGFVNVEWYNTIPFVNITSPGEGEDVGDTITVSGSAWDTGGEHFDTVQRVEVKIDSGGWQTATGTTDWTYAWNTTTAYNGDHVISARAYDGRDYSSVAKVNVSVYNPDNTPPVITGGPGASTDYYTATITWTTNEPSTSIVEYGATVSYGQSKTSAGYVVSHSVGLSGLQPGTVYHYRVKSTDEAGNGPTVSGDKTFTTPSLPDTTAPRVTGGPFVSVSETTAWINWTTDELATGTVEYGQTTSLGMTASHQGSGTSHSVKLSGLDWDTKYYYRIVSKDTAGNTLTGLVSSFQTPKMPDTTPPSISDLLCTVDNNTATITWITNEPADTRIEYGQTINYTLSKTIVEQNAQHQIVLTGLEWETTYHYRVGSNDPANNGPTWTSDQTFTIGPEPDTTPPSLTDGPNIVLDGNKATISWTMSEECTGIVEYGKTTGYGQTTTGTGYKSSHEIVLSGLGWDTTYHYRITCTDHAGNTYMTGDRTFKTPIEPDTINPTIQITNPSNNEIVWDEITIEASASDNRGVDRVEFYLDNVLTFTDPYPSYRWTLDTTTLTEGGHTIKAMAVDTSGNTQTDTITITVNRPNTAPNLLVTARPPNKIASTFTITGTVSDPDNDQLRVEASLDDGGWETIALDGDKWTYILDPSKLTGGEHTLRIRCWDGETYSTVETFTFTAQGMDSPVGTMLPIILVLLLLAGVGGVVFLLRKNKTPPQTGQKPTVTVISKPKT